jgi:ABC-type sugar transport system ATPase subunit
MAFVSLKNIQKIYPNGFEAVHSVDLQINDGEFMVFVGPSGCAKSTLLRMIAGLEGISGGDLYIGNQRVNDLAPKERGIAMVFQNYALYPHMKVFDNLAFGLKLSGMSRDEIRQRVHEASDLLEMTHLLDRYPKQLSGGQAQRVAVGRAIVKRPDVFLFDEPLSNLDAKLRAAMRVRLTDLHQAMKAAGKPSTVIYVTHDQVEAMTMGERICVLKDGHIQQVDTPLALYTQPSNIFVAGFIGSPEMNLIRGSLSPTSNGALFEARACKVEFRTYPASTPEKDCHLGIRPEHLSLSPPIAHQGGTIQGTLRFCEHMGHEVYVHLDANGQTLIARVPSEQATDVAGARRGDAIKVYFETDKCHLFDATSGLRVTQASL